MSVLGLARRAYFNIFALVEELGLDPFTPWTRSQQWSPAGLEVDAAILQVPRPMVAWLLPRWLGCAVTPGGA